jgi:DNA-binding PadR family transcriptional regulator
MLLPDLTHLQMVLIEALGARRMSGRELRAALKKLKVNKSSPAFYQLMSRMEEGDFVKGEYEDKTIEGVPIRERFYRITGHGVKAYDAARRFYAERSPLGGTATA